LLGVSFACFLAFTGATNSVAPEQQMYQLLAFSQTKDDLAYFGRIAISNGREYRENQGGSGRVTASKQRGGET
jgi:hypothetical protein